MNGEEKLEIYNKNIGLIHHTIKKYRGINRQLYDYEDLFQVGSLGLWKAIDRYDSDRGIALSTYAVITIRGEVKRFMRDCNLGIKIPRGLKVEYFKYKKLKESGYKDEELEGKLEYPISELKEVELHIAGTNYLDSADGDRESSYFSDVLSLDYDLEGNIIDKLHYERVIRVLKDILSERDLGIMKESVRGKYNQVKIGKMYGVPQVQVSRVYRKIVDRIIPDINRYIKGEIRYETLISKWSKKAS